MIQVNIRKFSYPLVFSNIVYFKNITSFQKLTMSSSTPDSATKTFDCISDLMPPSEVKNMKILDKSAFSKNVTVPCLQFEPQHVNKVLPIIKSYQLKLPNLRYDFRKEGKIYLKPSKDDIWCKLSQSSKDKLKDLGLSKDNFSETSIQLTYDNWNYNDIITAIIPDHLTKARGFSRIGHIIHLNLKPEIMEFKTIIGQVLLDKNSSVKTIVNKSNIINNTYRNFAMELICGEDNMVTQAKENGITFDFDFSKVYWNPRLSSEHLRIYSILKPNDILFDVFCGVGPFALPCAKKKCKVFANDLNPDCIKWLEHNVKLNKIDEEYIKIYNKDGADFIKEDIREKSLIIAKQSQETQVYVTMNLPAIALDFVKYFKGIFKKDELTYEELKKVAPKIFVYFFAFGNDYKITGPEEFEKRTGLKFDSNVMDVQFVRNVAPCKDMVKIIFTPPLDYLCPGLKVSSEEPVAKKACIQ